MLINATIVTILCTIALHTTCMNHDAYPNLEIFVDGEPCSIELPDDMLKKIAYHLATQDLKDCDNTRALRSTCKLLYEYLPKPTESSMRYRLWQQRKDEETIQKRKKNIKTICCIVYCGIWLPAVCGATVATAVITGKEWTALIPLGSACVLHCAGSFIGYECRHYWETL